MSENYDVTQPEIDRRDKAIMWLSLDVLNQGQGDATELYEIMEEHFMLKSKWAYRKFDEPTFTKAEVEQLIEAIAVKVEGLDGMTMMTGDFIKKNKVLATIRSTKL